MLLQRFLLRKTREENTLAMERSRSFDASDPNRNQSQRGRRQWRDQSWNLRGERCEHSAPPELDRAERLKAKANQEFNALTRKHTRLVADLSQFLRTNEQNISEKYGKKEAIVPVQ